MGIRGLFRDLGLFGDSGPIRGFFGDSGVQGLFRDSGPFLGIRGLFTDSRPGFTAEGSEEERTSHLAKLSLPDILMFDGSHFFISVDIIVFEYE